MTVFEINLNLLVAKVESNLGNEVENKFWSGYMLGLRHYQEDETKTGKIETNHYSRRDETKSFWAGHSEGSKGTPTAKATIVLDKIKAKESLAV